MMPAVPHSVTSDYMARLKATRNLSSHTLDAYESDLRGFELFSQKCPECWASSQTLLAYAGELSERRAAPRTIRRKFACLRGFFRDLVKEQIIATSPFDTVSIKLPRTRSLPRALPREDAVRLAAAAWRISEGQGALRGYGQDFGVAILTLLSVGLRISELVKLMPSDFDPAEGGLRVNGKGKKERRVFIVDQRLCEALASAATRNPGRSLLTLNGTPWTPQSFRQQLHRLTRAVGIRARVTPHMLRHTAATLLLEDGVDVLFLQRLLGHEDIATTALYAHVGDASLKRALQRANLLASFAA